MPVSQKGFAAQVLILVVLLVGLAVGFYLVKEKTNLLPKASVSGPTGPQTSFLLTTESGAPKAAGERFNVYLKVRSDLETANLFD